MGLKPPQPGFIQLVITSAFVCQETDPRASFQVGLGVQNLMRKRYTGMHYVGVADCLILAAADESQPWGLSSLHRSDQPVLRLRPDKVQRACNAAEAQDGVSFTLAMK